MKQIISFEKEIAFKTMIGEITSISLEHTLHFQNDSNITGDLIISGTYKMTEASTLEEPFSYSLQVDIMLPNELEEKDRLIAIDNFTYAVMNEEILKISVDILVQGLEKVEVLDIPEVEESLEETVVEKKEEKEVRKEQVKENEEHSAQEEMVQEEVQESMSKEDNNLQSQEEVMNSKSFMDQLTNKSESKKEEAVEKKEEKQEDHSNTGTVMNSIFSLFANTDETYTTYSVYILREDDNIEEVLNKYNITREELALYNNLDDLKIGSKLIISTSINEKDA